MGSAKQIKETKGKASPESKNAASKASAKSAAVVAKTIKKTPASKKETPAVKPASEKVTKKAPASSKKDIAAVETGAEKATKTKAQINEKPAPNSIKAVIEKEKSGTAKSSQTRNKSQSKKDSKASQKSLVESASKKPSEASVPKDSTPAAAKTEVKSGKKRSFASIKNETIVDSSDEENEEKSDLESEDEKQIMNKLDIDPKVNKPEKQSAFTGITYDTKTNDLSVSIQEKLSKRPFTPDEPVGVIFVGRLPTGFEEYELGVFFGQFGEIKKLRLSRNRKTGNSRHYAFIQYASQEVAKIVAEAVNNYLVYGRLMKCQVVPQDKIHYKMFWGASPSVIPFVQIERRVRTEAKSSKQIKNNLSRNRGKKNKLSRRLQELNIDYDISEFKPKRKITESETNTS